MENLSFEDWLEEVCKRPLPLNPMEQLETLAMELAEGSIRGYWSAVLAEFDKDAPNYYKKSLNAKQKKLTISLKYNFGQANIIEVLTINGYVEVSKVVIGRTNQIPPTNIEGQFPRLSKLTFDLIKQKVSDKKKATLFISYRRKESSAFALLLLNLLKSNGFDPFLDLAIKPGENWHSILEDYIKNRDYFIVLIGPTTLESSITIQEIEWAIQYERIVIPIWHNGFEFKPTDWSLPDEVSKVLATTHTIRITEESALDYHSAILELLNHFGIIPTL